MQSIFSLMFAKQYIEAVIVILARAFVVFCCLPFHEFAHGWTAYKLGDNTAKNQGRLTLNPIAHLNPIGTVMIFLFGIGYAQPVEVNPRNFKNPKKGMAITSLAGPLANVLLAAIFINLAYALAAFLPSNNITDMIVMFLEFAANINVVLAVFNLLPIPPLDGSKILAALLPYKQYVKYMRYERYIMIGLIVLLFTGILSKPIMILSNALMFVISFIPQLIFGAVNG